MSCDVKENCCAADFMPQDEMRELQLSRLQKIVRHAYDNVEFFRKRMDEKGVTPEDVKTLKDIQLLPFCLQPP